MTNPLLLLTIPAASSLPAGLGAYLWTWGATDEPRLAAVFGGGAMLLAYTGSLAVALEAVRPEPEREPIPIYGLGAERAGKLNPRPLGQMSKDIEFTYNLAGVNGRRVERLPGWLHPQERAALRRMVLAGQHPTHAALIRRGPFTRERYDRFRDEMLRKRLGVLRPVAFGKTGWALTASACRMIPRPTPTATPATDRAGAAQRSGAQGAGVADAH